MFTIKADLQLEAAAVYIPGSLQYTFTWACLKEDSGRYCGPVAALAAAFSDPGPSYFNYISNITDQDLRPDDCDICIAERLRHQAGSPYFDGPAVASESLYESMTSSCGISGRPVVTSTIDYFTSTPTPTVAICEGAKYTIQPSDDCYTISKTQGVGTAWLLSDNQLGAFCTKFPAAGTELCITNKCKTVTVGINTTCAVIANAAGITESQFLSWNPVIDYACSNLKSLSGSEVCIDAPGRKFVRPTDSSCLPPLTPSVPATKPTDVADGSGDKPCGRYYAVQQGDFCNNLVLKFGITLQDFLFLNTGVYSNCTNLFAQESYCVQAVGDINTYPGRPDYMSVTLDPGANFTGTAFTDLPSATAKPYSRLYPPLPLASGTRDDCVHYFPGDAYQFNLTGTSLISNCMLAVSIFNVDVDDFASWNPGLGDPSSSSCSFQAGVRYCGSWYLQKATPTTTSPDSSETGPMPPGPAISGQPADCNKWSIVTEGLSCTDMAANAGITLAQFLAWNPAVSPDCLINYWLDEAYCVGVEGTAPVSNTTTTALAHPTPPAPTMSGGPANCNKWAVVTDRLSCTDMASAAGISLAQFLAWNPAVSEDCLTNYWLGEAYCVGILG
ncbi:hypothetical protein SLS63_004975 [Diaporthe eres]|uniref:LysM domain-containing protein n=1 Tax=Diaporthe eres TaxID=83184 RepID=A0ABR1PCR5_DIAER